MRTIPVCLLMALLSVSCSLLRPPEPGLGEPIPWRQLEGWDADRHAEAWPALLGSCDKIGEQPHWRVVCRAARALDNPSDLRAKQFFEAHFQAHPVHGEKGRRKGLITGYYVPRLQGSFERDERYRHPLYAPPEDLLTIDLGDTYPPLAGRQLRGRLRGRTVTPYPDRRRLETSPEVSPGAALLWVDDRIDAFFLHVQGSGRVELPNGKSVAVGFADHNGRPYRSIGRRLVEMGELDLEEVNLFSIRRWLRSNPRRAEDLLHHNPRYVFFQLRDDVAAEPEGALDVPLTPGRSLAVDTERLPLGAPVWLQTSMPGDNGAPLNRLMMAQDTGGAIRGYNRADVFWGTGEEAERKAGLMKQSGRLFLLLPREK